MQKWLLDVRKNRDLRPLVLVLFLLQLTTGPVVSQSLLRQVSAKLQVRVSVARSAVYSGIINTCECVIVVISGTVERCVRERREFVTRALENYV